jgi:hypothetical protein
MRIPTRPGRPAAALATFATVLATGVASLGPAQAAADPIDPADEAWITAAGADLVPEVQYPGHLWTRHTTVRHTGAVPGRPGNRHTARLEAARVYSRFPVPWTLTLRHEQCPADPAAACVTLWAGTARPLPDQATVDPIGTDGATRIAMTLPASAWTTDEPPEAPVPAGATSVDVTMTPVAWRDPRVPDRSTAWQVSRSAYVARDTVAVLEETSGAGLTVTGTVAGVPASEVSATSWTDTAWTSADAGPGLGLVGTRAEMAPYAPAVRRGRVVAPTVVDVRWNGLIHGRVVTSTGYRLPGTTYEPLFYPLVELAAGDALAGSTTNVGFALAGYTCPAPAPDLAGCEPVELPDVQPSGPARYVVDPFGAVAIDQRLAVSRTRADGSTQSLGTVRLRLRLTPTGDGRPHRGGSLNRREPATWSMTRALQRDLTGRVTLGTAVGTPFAGVTPFVALSQTRSGDL